MALATIVLEDNEDEEMVDVANEESVEPHYVGNAEAVETVFKAPELGDRTLPLKVDDYNPQGYRCSNFIHAHHCEDVVLVGTDAHGAEVTKLHGEHGCKMLLHHYYYYHYSITANIANLEVYLYSMTQQ
nr:hypothetical protein [Hordeum vulgare subsp. vulgare]